MSWWGSGRVICLWQCAPNPEGALSFLGPWNDNGCTVAGGDAGTAEKSWGVRSGALVSQEVHSSSISVRLADHPPPQMGNNDGNTNVFSFRFISDYIMIIKKISLKEPLHCDSLWIPNIKYILYITLQNNYTNYWRINPWLVPDKILPFLQCHWNNQVTKQCNYTAIILILDLHCTKVALSLLVCSCRDHQCTLPRTM